MNTYPKQKISSKEKLKIQEGNTISDFVKKNTDYTQYPAAIRNYSIIKPIVKLFVGENDKRPHGHEVVVLNADTLNRFEDTLNSQIHDTLKQQFVNQLNELGVQTGMESKPTKSIEEIEQNHKANYKDERA